MDKIIQKLKTFFENKQNRYVAGIIFGVIIIALFIYFFNLFPVLEKIIQFGSQVKVIDDELVIPQTERVSPADGRIIQKGSYDTLLVPKSEEEEVLVVKAKLTVKGSYDSAIVRAKEWSDDAKLVFIKSLGAIDLGGKSSGWQIVFGSKTKKTGYEIIIQADKIISQKEIKSNSFGYDLPKNWYDSNSAIASLQGLPQFSDATVSSINFYYNLDGKKWGYALSTSRGTTSMPVK
ncbi:MAG: hypothetical protein AAB757_02945 [Patescibacteria group bacterium]